MTVVYAVIGGMHFEGEQFSTLRLFDCESAAHVYEKQLYSQGFDYVCFDTRKVCDESAIVS